MIRRSGFSREWPSIRGIFTFANTCTLQLLTLV